MVFCRIGYWRLERGMFRRAEIIPLKGGRTIYDAMKRRQVLDNLHHAPACPANHFHRQRLVFQRCTCGATRQMRDGATTPPLRKDRDIIILG
jgi:hypothetical protein